MMKLKMLTLLAAFSIPTMPALAADQVADLSAGSASFIGTAPLLDGGNDVITFVNLAAGTYDFLLSVSSQYLPDLTVDLNGQAGDMISIGNFRFASLESTGTTPFILTLTGTAAANSLYSGEFQTTVVPEPGTLALVLAGLGMVAGKARSLRPR